MQHTNWPRTGETWRLEAGKTMRVVETSYGASGEIMIWFTIEFGLGGGSAVGGLRLNEWRADVLPRGEQIS